MRGYHINIRMRVVDVSIRLIEVRRMQIVSSLRRKISYEGEELKFDSFLVEPLQFGN